MYFKQHFKFNPRFLAAATSGRAAGVSHALWRVDPAAMFGYRKFHNPPFPSWLAIR